MPFDKEFIEVLLEASDDYKESMILDYTAWENHVPTKMYADFVKANVNSPLYKTRIAPIPRTLNRSGGKQVVTAFLAEFSPTNPIFALMKPHRHRKAG